MAKTFVPVTELDNFSTWLTRTNQVAAEFANVLSTDSSNPATFPVGTAGVNGTIIANNLVITTGSLTLQEGTTFEVNIVDTSQIFVGDNVSINATSLLIGNSTVNSIITSTSAKLGNTTIIGFANISGTANVGGVVTLRDSVTVNGALTVANTAALGNTTITGFINVSSTANVGGAVNLRSTLAVNGALTVSNTAALGNTTITGNLSVSQVASLIRINAGGLGTTGQILSSGGPSGSVSWINPPTPGGGGTGTVTSVGLSLPTTFTVTNSPVTTSGTLTAVWASQSQNRILAAPSAASGTPTFRLLVESDIPSLQQAKIINLPNDLASKAPLASPTFTGIPAAPTAAFDTSTTQIATTKFVVDQGYIKTSVANDAYAKKDGTNASGNWNINVASVGGYRVVVGEGSQSDTIYFKTTGGTTTPGGTVSASWGSITGTLSSQTDLNNALLARVTTSGDQTIAGNKTFSGTTTFNNQIVGDIQKVGGYRVVVGEGSQSDTIYFKTTGGITSGATWGSITGTLSSQTDLNNALEARVALSGTQTISGNKTFSGTTAFTGPSVSFTNQILGNIEKVGGYRVVVGEGSQSDTIYFKTTGGTVSTSTSWGSITGLLSSQTDLNNALEARVTTSGAQTISGNKTFSGTTSFTGTTALSETSTVDGVKIGYRNVPVNLSNAGINLTAAYDGECIYKNNTSAYTYIIPDGLPDGTIFTFANVGSAGNITISMSGAEVLRLAGSTTTGSRTIAPYGQATVYKVGGTWLCGGPGVT